MSQEPRLYYFPETKERKAILIFDSGFCGLDDKRIGYIHVYEHKESLPASELNEQLRKYGHYINWDILGGAMYNEIKKKAIEEIRRNPRLLLEEKP